MELKRRVVGDHGVGRGPTRQEERIDLEVLRGDATGHDRVQAAPHVHQVSGTQVLAQDRPGRRGCPQPAPAVRGDELLPGPGPLTM